jgi:cold shock CspA family protein
VSTPVPLCKSLPGVPVLSPGMPDQVSVEEFGTVKFYDTEKGFGFINRDRGGKDIFVRASTLNRAGISGLVEGQRVVVDMVEGNKGPEAVSIRLI